MKKLTIICFAAACLLYLNFAAAWSWPCADGSEKNGKLDIEVLPYVKVNDGCGGFVWSRSDCAAAVSSECVYFLVRMTVPRDIDPIWYKYASATTLSFAKGGFAGTENGAATAASALPRATVYELEEAYPDRSEDGWAFYAYPTAPSLQCGSAGFTGDASGFDFEWLPATAEDITELSALDPTSYMWGVRIANASKAELCAETISDFSGANEWLTYGDYKIYFDDNGEQIFDAMIFRSCVDTELLNLYSIGVLPEEYIILAINSGKVESIDAETDKCGTFARDALEFFGISPGTCVTRENVRTNCGWKEKVKACYTWSGNGAAIIDVECNVEIPKTGDRPSFAAATALAGAACLMAAERERAG